jgi:hypothetical protein
VSGSVGSVDSFTSEVMFNTALQNRENPRI